MTTKVALLREVAKLLKKYKPADLSDAVSSLSRRGKSKNRSSPKARANTKRAKKKGVGKSLQSPKAKRPTLTEPKKPKKNLARHSETSGRAKPDFRTTDALRKSGLPEKRNVRTRDVADSFEDHTRSLAGARKDRSEDYARWFRIISGDAGETKPGDLVTESRPRQVEKSREWKEAITQLRIQELLLSGPFKLITTAPNNSRIITFLPNGAIGTGRTHLVARWRLFEGRLELLDAGEEVQSRFIVSSDGRFLTQILDPTAPSASPSQLVRVAAKS